MDQFVRCSVYMLTSVLQMPGFDINQSPFATGKRPVLAHMGGANPRALGVFAVLVTKHAV